MGNSIQVLTEIVGICKITYKYLQKSSIYGKYHTSTHTSIDRNYRYMQNNILQVPT